MSKVNYIWRIVENNDCFNHWDHGSKENDYKLIPRFKHWFFKTREMAEAAALPVVQKRHKAYVHDTIETVNDKYHDADQFDADEKRWWREKPPLNTYRTKTRTVYLVGDPFWDSQDRRGHCYGCIERVKVLMDGPVAPPLKTIHIYVRDGEIDTILRPDDMRLATIDETKVKDCQRQEDGPEEAPLVEVKFTGEKFKPVKIPEGTKVVIHYKESYCHGESAIIRKVQEFYHR
jgi:hypothetical protein